MKGSGGWGGGGGGGGGKKDSVISLVKSVKKTVFLGKFSRI